MYSYDERMRAVQFYIESGCSEIMVFRELGYPSPNALRQWYNEYMQTGTLHSKANRRDVYSQEQIDAAVAYYNEHGGSLIATCRAQSASFQEVREAQQQFVPLELRSA